MSQVVLGIDVNSQQLERFVALKVLTADALSGESHIDVLNMLLRATSTDPQHPGFSRIVQLLDHFEYKGPHGLHLCLVLEVMGPSLGDIHDLYHTKQMEVPSTVVKSFTKQLLLGLDYLHHSCGIVHTGTILRTTTQMT